MTEPINLTLALVDEGFVEINRWPDGRTERIKESGRLALNRLLAEEISKERLSKAEVLVLLRRARAILQEGRP